jgi:hypothetical protein
MALPMQPLGHKNYPYFSANYKVNAALPADFGGQVLQPGKTDR